MVTKKQIIIAARATIAESYFQSVALEILVEFIKRLYPKMKRKEILDLLMI